MEREQVYKKLDSLIEFHRDIAQSNARLKGEEYRDDSTRSVEDFLVDIASFYDDALHEARKDQGIALYFIERIACLSLRCMYVNGAVARGDSKAIVSLTQAEVLKVIDGERDYQDALPADRTDGRVHSVNGFLLMLHTYINRAIDGWTLTAGDHDALDNIRKVAGICVACLEAHGKV